MGDDLFFGGGQRSGRLCIAAQGIAFEPVRPREAAYEVAARGGEPVDVEVGEAGIERGIGVAGEKAALKPWLLGARDAPQHAQAGAGLRILQPRCGLDEQARAWIAGEVAGVVGDIGQQQDRAGVEIAGDGHQRCVRPAVGGCERRRQRRLAGLAQQTPCCCGDGHAVRIAGGAGWRSTRSRKVMMPTGWRLSSTTSARERLNWTSRRTA